MNIENNFVDIYIEKSLLREIRTILKLIFVSAPGRGSAADPSWYPAMPLCMFDDNKSLIIRLHCLSLQDLKCNYCLIY